MAGDQYEFLVAGDVDRDGQFVEAWKGDEQRATLFSAYRTSETKFWCAEELPLSVVERMIAIAIEQKPPANDYDFLLRKGEK